ncbi:Mobile element protein (plasmid) [Rhodovulum sp. P5]|uniref:Tn3 family transposase n=1 Tax=Rhodovulum sp. P5 TaxID=1564506 RepID=UPI0009C1BC9D|nr:Tn3 family transposase [Rhodovulum sp. P5]ARE42288.1 Mobile element protein [Rhodovulum sp. P5]ARE42476.1 Mobile element protein [Rhodovulum sp. P5]
MQQIWSDEELRAHWVLSASELGLLKGTSESRRLTLCYYLKYFQLHARFPKSLDLVSPQVLKFLASQIAAADDDGLAIVPKRTDRFYRRQVMSFLDIALFDKEARALFLDWLIEIVLPTAPNQATLDAVITERFLSNRMIRPKAKAEANLLARAERRFERIVFARISERLADDQRARLDALLETEGGFSPFAEVARSSGAASVENVLKTVERLEAVRAVGLDRSILEDVHPDIVERFRLRAGSEDAWDMRRHPDETRYALLFCFLVPREAELTDELGDLLISITHKISARAETKVIKELVAEYRKVEGKTALLFKMAIAANADPDGRVRDVIFPAVGQKTISDLAAEYHAENPSFSYRVHRKVRRSYAQHYRRILPVILKTLTFRSNNQAWHPLLDAIAILIEDAGKKPQYFSLDQVPLEGVVRPKWRDIVIEARPGGKNRINRLNYEICVLQSLRERLRTKELWIEGARRYCDPDQDLPQDFDDRKERYFQELGQPVEADHFVQRLKFDLSAALDQFDRSLPTNKDVTLRLRRGKSWISLKPLKAQDDPTMLEALKEEMARRWPMTSLLDVLKEVDLRLEFTKSFPTAAARQTLPEGEVSRRLLLALYGIGTNIGLKAIAAGPHNVTYKELLYIRQRFIHKNALRAATRAIADATNRARLADIWGESSSSCASDSTQLASWDQNLMTEWHQRYGGRGVMIYWHVDAKATCIHSQLKQVSSSEVASMIEGVLHHGTELEIDRQFVDTHGQSVVGFAFCYLLGFDLMPRFKAIARQKLVRAVPKVEKTYKNLDPLFAPKPINWDLIAQHYDEMIKLAVALKQRTAEPEAILRRFIRGQSHPVFAALLELGKAAKTLFLCKYLSDKDLRREINSGLNVIERWNGVNNFIFYGNGNELVSNRRDDQEISVLSLHLLQGAMVYVNTLMIQDILADQAWRQKMTDRDMAALNPLPHSHINPYGVFDLDMNSRLPLNDMSVAA